MTKGTFLAGIATRCLSSTVRRLSDVGRMVRSIDPDAIEKRGMRTEM